MHMKKVLFETAPFRNHSKSPPKMTETAILSNELNCPIIITMCKGLVMDSVLVLANFEMQVLVLYLFTKKVV